MVFVVSEKNVLLGLATDGDVRRALLRGATLDTPITEIMNRNYISSTVHISDSQLLKLLSKDRARHIPLVDENNVLVDYASTARLHQIQVLQPNLSGNELAYVTECIKTNWISSKGLYVRKFEEMFATYCRTEDALAVSNGTVAIHLALEALHVGEGDEVIVPDFTFAATINAVLHAGATPVIVDVEPATWTMDVSELEEAITAKTKAIIPVHIYGHPCRMHEILDIAKNNRLFIIEDCAEALGSKYKDVPVGTFGDAATFSFFGNKTITTGEGGMVLFRDRKIAERAALLRDHGMSKERRYWHEEVGYNYRMTNIQAAIGVAQMERLDGFVERKRAIAGRYNERLLTLQGFEIPAEESWAYNSYWLYTVLVDSSAAIQRDELISKLLLNGIETRPAFFPLHEMPPYRKFAGEKSFTTTERIALHGLSLPSSVSLTDREIDTIVDSLTELIQVRDLITNH